MADRTLPRHQKPAGLNTFLFGVPYYPEHWSLADRKDDAQRMVDSGVNVVRMAEFAWDLMEPQRDRFDFSLFDDTIAALGERGIKTILCTPTATPPRWLTEGHDDWLRVDADGRRMAHGNRQHCCTTHEDFRGESRRITEAMARHFAGNPHVIGWQTDNELYCHQSLCYCTACQEAFCEWLEDTYGTIEELNRCWGTAFWAQTYSRFGQIPLPYVQARPSYSNPTHLRDYYRFVSDMVIEFQRQQVEILRLANPPWWITHNGTFGHIDYWTFTEDLDFLGVDVYPGFVEHADEWGLWAAVKNQHCRAASGGYIVPEQQGGAGGQHDLLHRTPPPGRMRLWAYQSIAHGADGMMHFRWRTCRFGSEEYWNGILDHDNVPRRRYEEFAREGRELQRIGDRILNTVVEVKAAVLLETDQDEAHAGLSLGLPGPASQAYDAFAEMRRRHLPCGMIDARDSYQGVELLVLPSMLMMDDAFATKLRAYVEAGGVLLVTARTATKDRNNHVIAQTPPGLLADLCGMKVEEFGKIQLGEMSFTLNGHSVPAGIGYEVLSLGTAEAAATWNAAAENAPSAASGQPAITVNRLGRGAVVYVGTYLTKGNSAAIFDIAQALTRLAPLAEAPQGVEVTCRHRDGRRLLFLLNHTTSPQEVCQLPAGLSGHSREATPGTDLLSENPCTGQWTLEPYGVAIIEVN